MKTYQDGFGTAGVFFLLALLSSCILALSAFYVNVQFSFVRSQRRQQAQDAMHRIIADVECDFNRLTDENADSPQSSVLQYIKNKYASYSIDMQDVSSGIPINFITDSDMENKSLRKLLFLSDTTAEQFKLARKENPFFTDIQELSPFLSADGLSCCVLFGWINTALLKSQGVRTINAIANSDAAIFPLMNRLPQMNIYRTNPQLIALFLSRSEFHITEPELKLKSLRFYLDGGYLFTKASLAELLGIKPDSLFFEYFGFKTQFWQVSLQDEECTARVVIAAFPKDESSTEIGYYNIISSEVSYEKTVF